VQLEDNKVSRNDLFKLKEAASKNNAELDNLQKQTQILKNSLEAINSDVLYKRVENIEENETLNSQILEKNIKL